MLTLAIIGTAGRGRDANNLDAAVWSAMYAHARARTAAREEPVRLVSGGAAWADHLAVELFRYGAAEALSLYLPASFTENGFVEAGNRRDPGRTANHYHRQFAAATGQNPIAEIDDALRRGAYGYVIPGFKQRNSAVARVCDGVVAFTCASGSSPVTLKPDDDGFADPLVAGLRDGGTADTWRKAGRALFKEHVPVGSLPVAA